jgi:hypothetical protein
MRLNQMGHATHNVCMVDREELTVSAHEREARMRVHQPHPERFDMRDGRDMLSVTEQIHDLRRERNSIQCLNTS